MTCRNNSPGTGKKWWHGRKNRLIKKHSSAINALGITIDFSQAACIPLNEARSFHAGYLFLQGLCAWLRADKGCRWNPSGVWYLSGKPEYILQNIKPVRGKYVPAGLTVPKKSNWFYAIFQKNSCNPWRNQQAAVGNRRKLQDYENGIWSANGINRYFA